MLPLERQNKILEYLSQKKAASVAELCALLYSSGATIRRDLKALEHGGLLCRTHGGAVYLSGSAKDSPAVLRETENTGPKQIIARRALEFIQDGQTIFLDASTTACRLAEQLEGFLQLRVITNGLKTANILSKIDGIQVYGTGGRLRENAQSFVGAQAQEFISRFHADLAFFSCRGLHPEAGITDSTEDEAEIKKQYLKHATRSVLLCDSSKLGRRLFCRIGPIESVWDVVSNIPLPPEYRPRR